MELSAYEIALIGVLSTVLGVCITFLLTHWSSIKLSKIHFIQSKELIYETVFSQNFTTTGNELFKVWRPIYLTAYEWKTKPSIVTNGDYIVSFIINKICPNSEFKTSAIIFSRFLSKEKRDRFESLCNRIVCMDNDEPNYEGYKLFLAENDSCIINAIDNFYNTVDEILKFTER